MNDSSHQCEREKTEKDETTRFPWEILAWAVLGYGTVYFLFVAQIGLPAGKDLSNREWLSFLGGYLGFVGSLVMSAMVYRQEKQLAQLTLRQNDFYLECAVETVEYAVQEITKSNQYFHIPKKFKNSRNYSGRYFYSDGFRRIGNSTQEEKCESERTLILSTALYCSQNVSVSKIRINKISFVSIPNEETIMEYELDRGPNRDCISQTHNQLLLSHFLPQFDPLQQGEYKIVFNVNYNTFKKKEPEMITVFLVVGHDGIKVIDGIENPHIFAKDLYV